MRGSIGACLSSRDEQGLYCDLQLALTTALGLDQLLVFAQVCHGCSSSATARKRKVASLARLLRAPSALDIRAYLAPYPVVIFHVSSRSHTVYKLSDSRDSDADVRSYLISWGVEALVERRDLAEASSLPTRRSVAGAPAVQHALSVEDMAAPLATLAALLRHSACEAIGAAVVKLLKQQHASGSGCGRPRVLTSCQAIVRHVQSSPLALCGGRFANPAALREERVVEQVIQRIVDREYAARDAEDPEMLYYLP